MNTTKIALSAILSVALTLGAHAGQTMPLKHSPDRILQYTFVDKTLPDGKHPVWVYYVTKIVTVRVDMPSMDLCLVSEKSKADMALLLERKLEEVPRSEIAFAMKIYDAAFLRHQVLGVAANICGAVP